jgi:HEAT repeat protein
MTPLTFDGVRDLLAALQPHLGAADLDALVRVIDANLEILRGEHAERIPQMEAIEVLEGAVSELGRTGQAKAVKVLADLLDETYHAICTVPVGALGVASPIGRMWSLVKVTIASLGDTGAETAIEPLIAVLRGKQARSFADTCTTALGRISRKLGEREFQLFLSKLRGDGITGDSDVVKQIKKIRGVP